MADLKACFCCAGTAVKPVAQEGAQLTASVSHPPSAKVSGTPDSSQQMHGMAAEEVGRAVDGRAMPTEGHGEDANGWSFEGFDIPDVAQSHAEPDAAASEQQQDAGAGARPDRLDDSRSFSVLAGVSTLAVHQQTWSAHEPRQEGPRDSSVPPRSKGSTPRSLLSPRTAPPVPQDTPTLAPDRSIPIPTGVYGLSAPSMCMVYTALHTPLQD